MELVSATAIETVQLDTRKHPSEPGLSDLAPQAAGRYASAMWKFAGLGLCSLFVFVLSSCMVTVENPITADAGLDERLIGVWKPVWRSEAERGDPDAPRTLEDLGMEMVVIGKTEDGFLKAVLIDGFDSKGFGVGIELIAKTRSHKGKNFILAELQWIDQREDDEKRHVVVEYEFSGEGDLFLYGIHEGMFDKEAILPELAHRVDESGFGEQVVITAEPDRLLDWIVDPKVAGQLISLGKYRKMILPPGNSPAITEPAPTE
jgi:hypothetical protein